MPTFLLVAAAGITGFVGAEWAPAANTALLILLALFHAHERRQVRKAERLAQFAHEEARDAKRRVGANRRDTPERDTGERRRWTDAHTNG